MTDKPSPPAKQAMDYAELLKTLEQASSFDLFRLENVILRELESPERIQAVKQNLRPGQRLSYFDTWSNSLHPCEVIKLNQKRVLVRDFTNNKQWAVPYYALNIEGTDARVNHESDQGLSRHSLSLHDIVGFRDRQGIERAGKVIRLNTKTVTLQCPGSHSSQWRVSYSLLYRVLDSDTGVNMSEPKSIEGMIVE